MDQNNSSSDQIACPLCNRDYELPRRYLIHLDDYDFSPIPRLLPCLHSMCHSCLEEQFEKNDYQFIECVLCHHKEVVKGINFLPLDLTILKQIVNTNSTELLASCARCYDVVPSVSWCETCSSALCEFHHQDHKLSVETSKHNFNTFKEYFYQKKHIEYRFPPVSCGECAMQDCEYYCQNCYHLISAKAFIEFHKTHEIQSTKDIFPEMKSNVQKSVQQSKKCIEELQVKIKKIKEYLNQLDENEENNLLLIHKQFNLIYSHLKQREKELTNNFTTSIDIERKKLLSQLSNMVELVEDYQQVVKTGNNFLSFALQPTITTTPVPFDQSQQQQLLQQQQQPPPPPSAGNNQVTQPQQPQSPLKKRVVSTTSARLETEKNDHFHEPMYLIAATDSIEDRCDYLEKLLKERIEHFNKHVIPLYSMEFNTQDLNMIHGTINCLGAMNEYPFLNQQINDSIEDEFGRKELHENKTEIIMSPRAETASKFEENYGSIHFSINMQENNPQQNQMKSSSNSKNNHNNPKDTYLHPSASKASFPGANTNNQNKEQSHSLFIETRWIPPKSYPLPLFPGQEAKSTMHSPRAKSPRGGDRGPGGSAEGSQQKNTTNPETETPRQEKEEGTHLDHSFHSIIEMYHKIFSEGILLGRIEINEKIIKKLNEKFKYKTYFQSKKDEKNDYLPDQKNHPAQRQSEKHAPGIQLETPANSQDFPTFQAKTLTLLSITKELIVE